MTLFMRTLRTAQNLATILGDHGFPPTEVRATKYGSIGVHLEPDRLASIVAATLDLPVTETKHFDDSRFTVVVVEFRTHKVDLFGAYEGALVEVAP